MKKKAIIKTSENNLIKNPAYQKKKRKKEKKDKGKKKYNQVYIRRKDPK